MDFPADRARSPAVLTMPLSWIYEWLTRRYHRRWDHRTPYRVAVPVISVGNLCVGGTGKTPFVMALCRHLAERIPAPLLARRIAVLSRGYGRLAKGLRVVEVDSHWEDVGDEPLLIKRELPSVEVVVHEDRRRAADHAVDALGASLLILDDGFQHRRLARDLDIVLVDGEQPLGNGYLLPAGPLREPVDALSRASLIVGVGEKTEDAQRIAARFEKPFVRARAEISIPRLPPPNPPASRGGEERVPASRGGSEFPPVHGGTKGGALGKAEIGKQKSEGRVFVLTSIARPQRFVKALLQMGFEIAGVQSFRDHHRFTRHELQAVAQAAHAAGADVILTTAKDAVRIGEWSNTPPLIAARYTLKLEDAALLDRLIDNASVGLAL